MAETLVAVNDRNEGFGHVLANPSLLQQCLRAARAIRESTQEYGEARMHEGLVEKKNKNQMTRQDTATFHKNAPSDQLSLAKRDTRRTQTHQLPENTALLDQSSWPGVVNSVPWNDASDAFTSSLSSHIVGA